MELSSDGAAFIAQEEGVSSSWYKDQGGTWTIGIGHVWNPETDEDFAYRDLALHEIWELFDRDVKKYVTAVQEHVTAPLTQTQFDRLVSFAFNWGISPTTGFPATSVVRLINAGDFTGAARELVDGKGPSGRPYDKGLDGVRSRRIREAEPFRTAGGPAMPKIVSRSEWGAEPASGMPLASYPMSRLWLHHSDTVPTDDPAYDMRLLQQIGVSRGFADVSYTFALHPGGTILEGRDLRYVGAHTAGNNSTSLAFVLIGNYDRTPPTPAQVASARWLRDHLVAEGYLTAGTYPTGGHQDAPGNATGCPGAAAESRLDLFRAPSDGPPPTPDPPEEDDMATDHILLTYGTGVALWHTSGKVVTLTSSKQVNDYLTRGALVMDDLSDEQVARINGAEEAFDGAPELAHLVPTTGQGAGCLGGEGLNQQCERPPGAG